TVLFLELVVWISYVIGLSLLCFLSYRLLLWFKSNHNAVVLAYSVAVMAISINAVFTVLYFTGELNNGTVPANIRPEIAFIGNYTKNYDVFNAGYFISSVISFILTWVATV